MRAGASVPVREKKCPWCGAELIIRTRTGGHTWFFRNINMVGPILFFLYFAGMAGWLKNRYEGMTGWVFAVGVFGSLALAVFLAFWTEQYLYDAIPIDRDHRLGECPVCGNGTGRDAIDFGKIKVCPQCKDEYVQRVKEGVAD